MEKPAKKHIDGQKVVLDRFEEGRAVVTCEDGADFSVNRNELPEGAAAGDTLVWHAGHWQIDAADTEARRRRIAEKRRRLFNGEKK